MLLFGQGTALVVLLPSSWIVAGHAGIAALGWGAAAGIAGTTGSYCLLRGYRTGRLAVVSPAASAAAAGIPVVIDLGRGLEISAVAGTGVVLAIAAVVLVGAQPAQRKPKSTQAFPPWPEAGGTHPTGGLSWGLAAGAAHAAMYLLLAQAPADAGLWPVTALFVVLVAIAAASTLPRHTAALPSVPNVVPGLLVIGVLSATGTVGFLLASNAGSVAIAAVTTELSPVVTAVLARVFLHEHLPRLRIAGLVLAVAATALIGLG